VLITKTIMTQWNPNSRKWYESKGYVYTKWKDKFKVKIEDLPPKSSALVDIECDGCGEILTGIRWSGYTRSVHEDGKYYCRNCAIRLFGGEKNRKTRLKNGKSFEQWCIDNMLKEEANNLLLRWSYTLNIDNDGKVIHPKDVNYGTNGLNDKGFWLNCLDHPEHNPEQKSIRAFTGGQKGSILCNQCNKIATTHPHLVKFLVNEDDAFNHSAGSGNKILIRCIDCNYEKEKSIYDWINRGFGCPRCSDGVPYPEKFMFSLLEQLLDKKFKTQLSKSTFKWCNNYKYDNYIDNLNCIIETHGEQHYKENSLSSVWRMSLEETQVNDLDKEWLARSNNIKNYIIINCRYSDLDWIKKSVMESKLPKLLNFKEEDIDWLKCHEYSCKSFVKKACDLWNSGIKNATEIAEKLNIERRAIIRYLKQGDKLDWCIYPKKIICLNTREVFSSQSEAKIKYGIKDSGISMCCSDKQKSAGKDSKTDDPLRWMFYDEYLIKNQTIGWYNDYMSTHSYNGKIICLTTGEIFNTQVEAGEIYHINRRKISMCCNNKIQFVGRHPITEEPLRWMFYNEYINTIDTREEVTTIGRDTNSIAHIL